MAAEKTPRKIELLFFRSSAGSEPVREWLKGLDEVDRRAIGTDLLRAQWRWPAGMAARHRSSERMSILPVVNLILCIALSLMDS